MTGQTMRTAMYGAGLVVIMLAIAGCQDRTQNAPVTTKSPSGESTAPAGAAAARRDNALVRFVHAIPAGATVDVSADDRRAFENVRFKTVTPYSEMKGQRYTFRLRPAGMATADALASNTEGLDDGDDYTIFAVPGDSDAATLRVVQDDFSKPSADKARVRVVHASRDAGEIDVFEEGRKDEIFDSVDFQSVTTYNDIDPWTGSLDVRAEGETVNLVTLPGVKFDAGKVYTVVVTGKLRGTPKLEAFVIEDRLGVPTGR